MSEPKEANGNGNLPGWAKALSAVGLPGVIALYLLGAVPGVRSPFDRIAEEFRAAAQAMDRHERTAQQQLILANELLRVNRHTCVAAWRGSALMQDRCGPPYPARSAGE